MVAPLVVEKQMARICPAPHWKWEALAHGADAFLIGFPSTEDLERVDGFQMKVQSTDTLLSISTWKVQEIPHKFELKPVWVTVEGVPYSVRHFHGLWAVGSLIGTTLDVDLVTLRRRGVVRLLVAMLDPKILEKRSDANGQLYIGLTVVLKLRGYDFFFRKQPDDFVPDADFVPFFGDAKAMILMMTKLAKIGTQKVVMTLQNRLALSL
jgi:hypothetical protein